MRFSRHRAALAMVLSIPLVVVTACSGPQGTQALPAGASAFVQRDGSPSRTVHPAQASESVLYSFVAGQTDGAFPVATMRNMRGALYGTTYYGGPDGAGIVFSVTTSGSEQIVHTFTGGGDGSSPESTVTTSGFGVTEVGGTYGGGTFYQIPKSGKEKVLYDFGSGSDGYYPDGALVEVGGIYYGTTFGGGANGDGTVFSITPSGTEKVLYSFAGGSDGANPQSDLLNINGTLYGTTTYGGPSNGGTVFRITTAGAESVLYAFKGGLDGANPWAGLTKVGSALYGTTSAGGYPAGLGTVFKVTRTGKETVLHSFFGPPDGSTPRNGNLLLFNHVLYGTTELGGTKHIGTVFSITTGGAEAVLYSFGANGSQDGAEPYAGLTAVGSVLYGVTGGGGTSGQGTVFSLTP